MDDVKEKAVSIGVRTMLGDLMRVVVDELKAAPGAWHEMTEGEQEAAIERIERRCGQAITDAARIIATEGRPAIQAQVESVAFKNGVKAVIVLPNGPGAHALADATKSNVLIVFPGAESMMGGERVAADPQQPPLNLDGNPLAGAIGLDDPPAGDEPEAGTGDEGGEEDDD